jgi:hypothetical protein
MKKKKFEITIICIICSLHIIYAQQTVETQFRRPLSDILTEISLRFGVSLTYNIDTINKVLPYADFRIRPYSVEESLTNVLTPFDYKFEKQGNNHYKLKPYEYYRRTIQEGEKMLIHLRSQYPDKGKWEKRKFFLYQEVRKILGIDSLLEKREPIKPLLSKTRKFAGYTVQNFAIETLRAYMSRLYLQSSFQRKSCTNYLSEWPFRWRALSRRSAVENGYTGSDGSGMCGLRSFGWGESALQVGNTAHRSSAAQVIQALNGITILDYMLNKKTSIKKESALMADGGEHKPYCSLYSTTVIRQQLLL